MLGPIIATIYMHAYMLTHGWFNAGLHRTRWPVLSRHTCTCGFAKIMPIEQSLLSQHHRDVWITRTIETNSTVHSPLLV